MSTTVLVNADLSAVDMYEATGQVQPAAGDTAAAYYRSLAERREREIDITLNALKAVHAVIEREYGAVTTGTTRSSARELELKLLKKLEGLLDKPTA